MKFDLSNIWKDTRTTVIGGAVAVFVLALVWPLRLATFDQVSPLLLVVVPLLLAGPKKKRRTPDAPPTE